MAILTFPDPARGVISRPHLHEQAARQQAGRIRPSYESHEFSVPVLATDLTLRGGGGSPVINHGTSCSCARADPAAFAINERAQQVVIRNNGALTLTVRFNVASSDAVTVSPGEILDWPYLEVTEVYFTNPSGVTVIPVKVVLS
jgi:hypothetical protein